MAAGKAPDYKGQEGTQRGSHWAHPGMPGAHRM